MNVLGTKRESYQGDFVHQNQEMGTKDGFKNVSKLWLQQTMSYDEAMEQMEADRANRVDHKVGMDKIAAVADERKLKLSVCDAKYVPTEHALNQLANRWGVGSWYAKSLNQGDHPNDAKVLAICLSHGQLKEAISITQSKRKEGGYLIRTNGPNVRAVLTQGYRIIDNRWVMEIVRSEIPGGRVSHWRGDSDTIWGNILIPDTIREETDSDYGGMLSVGNCEIGTRMLYTQPSVFRAICMNGCIWDQEKGTQIRQVHRGKFSLDDLRVRIVENLRTQIPLLPKGIQLLLGLRAKGTDGVSMKPIVAQAAMDFKLTPNEAVSVLTAYNVESKVSEANNLFGLVNSFTRAGQTLSNERWYDFDRIGGQLVNYNDNRWASLIGRAKVLTVKEVEAVYGTAV